MIKINISNSKMEEIEEKHYQYFNDNYKNKLEEFCNKSRIHDQDFYKYLLKNIKEIIIGKPEKLDEIITHIKIKFPKLINKIENKNSIVNKRLKEIFNYSKFVETYPIKTKPNRWCPYQLVKELKVNICPYCNRQYIITYHPDPKTEEKGKTRPTLDHFFAKKKYPYLALSLYNLVPSCKVCNSDLKGSKEFTYGEYIHPYEEGFGDKMKFSIELKKEDKENQKIDYRDLEYLDVLCGNSDEFDIKLKAKLNKNHCHVVKKAKNNKEIFKLEKLYEFHKDYVIDLIKKNKIYPKTRIDYLHKNNIQIFNSRDEVLRAIISNYITEDNLDKRVLAKLTKDICDELKLFK